MGSAVVDQGAGDPNVRDWNVSVAARIGAKNTQVLVLASAAVALPTTALRNRKALAIQNNGPKTIYVTFDGSAPSNSNGLWIATGTMLTVDAGPSIAVKAIADTSDQVSGAATQVLELS